MIATPIKLLPCPFCGGERINDFHIRDGRAIGCGACGASVHAYSPNALEAATEKWNQRSPIGLRGQS